MNKIIIISAVFPPEQVTSAFLNYDLSRVLSKDYQVEVLRPRPTRPEGTKFNEEIWKDPDFKTIQINSFTCPKSELIGRFREAIDFSLKCCKYIKQHHKQISFVYNDGWQLFGLYLIARVCVKYKIPYIVPIQDIYPESLFTNKHIPKLIRLIINPILAYFDKYYQKHAKYIRTITDEMADYLSKSRKIDRKKYIIINNWQNDEEFMELKTTNKDSNILSFYYVGSINSHANVDLIIKAFIKANIPNSQLKIYGGGSKKNDCINIIKKYDVNNVFFDVVSRQEVPKIQSEADALVLALPSGNGNLCLPSKLTSYLLSGKPVIASVDNDSSTSHIIQSQNCGIVANPDNEEALAAAFIDFSKKGKNERLKMSSNGKSYAISHLSREINLKELENIITTIIRNE